MIKDDIVAFRNSNPSYRTLLGVVIGEVDRGTPKDHSDEKYIQVLKKMIESNSLVTQTAEIAEENFILSKFIPTQLSDDDIIEIINQNNFMTIRDCMTYFKENYPTKYNGKTVSKLFNEKK